MTKYYYTLGGFPPTPQTNDTLDLNGTIYVYNGTAWEVGSGDAHTFTYTTTANQTTFSGNDTNGNSLSYVAGQGTIHVFLNGVLLDESDYTSTDGTSVVFNESVEANASVSIIAFKVVQNDGTGGQDSWSQNGANELYRLSNVGIGLDNPAFTLDVAGDINLTGSLKVNGANAVFSNWTLETNGSISRASHVIPGADSTYDLGSATSQWRDLYLSGASLVLGGERMQKTVATDKMYTRSKFGAIAGAVATNRSGLKFERLEITDVFFMPDDTIETSDIKDNAVTPAKIALDSSNRFVTDAEKSTWNNKANASHGTHVVSNGIGITELDVSDGSNGQALMTNGAGTLSFGDVDALPSQPGHANKVLKTDGTNATWQADLNSETTTSLSINANVLTYTDEDGTDTDIDLSLYLDDSNLARLVSGTLDAGTGIATFTRDDATTFTVDMSSLLDDTKLTDADIAAMGYIKVDTQVTVNDTLTSTSTTEALSAKQGKVLQDNKVDNSRVLTDVPSGAVFTDTVYSHPATHTISEVAGLQAELDNKVTMDDVIAMAIALG